MKFANSRSYGLCLKTCYLCDVAAKELALHLTASQGVRQSCSFFIGGVDLATDLAEWMLVQKVLAVQKPVEEAALHRKKTCSY